ncbi:MFS transporter [Rhizobium sp. SL42]|uniref:MFS transporter n=1 Tax=Rhizobium sp. SL42 TaxID=2806346 RepID=UPI001EFFBF42|nr:MFS transporter [Rhizobium sp. SL42]UJW76813.1 MFS transporter [Rhizobium sp. SL42]
MPQPMPQPMPPARAALYIGASILLFVTQGLGMQFASANLVQLQGELQATTNESAWLMAAYMAPYASMAIALVKVRTQVGLRRFAEWSVIIFLGVSILNLAVHDLQSGMVVRFISGMGAAPLSTLGFLYMLEAFPPARKLTVGIALALTNTALSAPLARLISPILITYGGWHSLYMFELGLALLIFPIIYLLPLTPIPHAKVIGRQDVLSYLCVAVGFGALAVVLSVGRLYWWFEAPWIGVLLAVSIAALTLFILMELPRTAPMVDIRWLLTPQNLHFIAVLLVFRFVAAEQTSTATSFYLNLGINDAQIPTLYWIMLAGSLAGGLASAWFLDRKKIETAHVLALLLIATGAYLDAHATNLTRPQQMYLSQAMVAAGAALFLPTAMAKGLVAALAKGPQYMLTFIVIFLFTQAIGGLIASAALGTFMVLRQQFHLKTLLEHFVLTDPMVADRVQTLSATYAKVVADKAALATEGITLLQQQISREAYVLAYNDTFLLTSIIAGLALAALLGHLGFEWLRQRTKMPELQASNAE